MARCAGCKRKRLCRLRAVGSDVFGKLTKWLCAQCETLPASEHQDALKVHALKVPGEEWRGTVCGKGGARIAPDWAGVTCGTCLALRK